MTLENFIVYYMFLYPTIVTVVLIVALNKIKKDSQNKFLIERRLICYMEYIAPKDSEEYRNHIDKFQGIMGDKVNLKAMELANIVWTGIRSYEIDNKLLPAIKYEDMEAWVIGGK